MTEREELERRVAKALFLADCHENDAEAWKNSDIPEAFISCRLKKARAAIDIIGFRKPRVVNHGEMACLIAKHVAPTIMGWDTIHALADAILALISPPEVETDEDAAMSERIASRVTKYAMDKIATPPVEPTPAIEAAREWLTSRNDTSDSPIIIAYYSDGTHLDVAAKDLSALLLSRDAAMIERVVKIIEAYGAIEPVDIHKMIAAIKALEPKP